MESPAVHPDPLKRAEPSRRAEPVRRREEEPNGPDFAALLQNVVALSRTPELEAAQPAARRQPTEAARTERNEARPEPSDVPRDEDRDASRRARAVEPRDGRAETSDRAQPRAEAGTEARTTDPTDSGERRSKLAAAKELELRPETVGRTEPKEATEGARLEKAPLDALKPAVGAQPAKPAQGTVKPTPDADPNVGRIAEAIADLTAPSEGEPRDSRPVGKPSPELAAGDAKPQPEVGETKTRPGFATATGVTDAPDAEAEPIDLTRALAAEDELDDAESQRLLELERKRGIDDARIQSMLEGKGEAFAAAAGRSGGGALGGQGREPGQFGKAMLGAKGSKGPTTPQAAAGFSGQIETQLKADRPEAPQRPRGIARAVLEQAREMARARRTELGKLSLSIRLDETTEVQLRITPRADGTHELAFMVADPRLRHELQRALPEIRNTASELPIDVADVWIGDIESTDSEIVDDREELDAGEEA